MPHRQRPLARSRHHAACVVALTLSLVTTAASASHAETAAPPAPAAAQAAAPDAKPASTASSVEIRNVATSWDNLSELFSGSGLATPFSEGSVFVVRGELLNRSDKPVHHVLLRYELLDAGGAVVHDLEGFNRLAEAMRPDESGKVDAAAVKPIPARGNDTFRMVFFGDETPKFASHRVRVIEVFDK